jgi:hypothetical protein
MRKQTNTLSPSPKGFQSPKFSDSDSYSDSDVRKALHWAGRIAIAMISVRRKFSVCSLILNFIIDKYR